ncbi:MAG: metallophosphoesterase [Mucinivorans sp.]
MPHFFECGIAFFTTFVRMIIVIVLMSLAVIGLLLDAYIYYRTLRHASSCRWLRILYFVQAGVFNLGMVVVMGLYESLIGSTTDNMVMVMWLILIFMMSFLPKLIFALFSIIELLVSKIFKRSMHWLLYCGLLLGLSLLGVMMWGVSITRNNIKISRVDIISKELPESFNGFKIAFFSDVHLGNLGGNQAFLNQLVDKINSLDADIVFQGGDFVNAHSSEFTPLIKAIFERITSPVYSVLGNHDLGIYINNLTPEKERASLEQVIALQKQMGWQVLIDQQLWLHRNGDSISLAGLNYPQKAKLGISQQPIDPKAFVQTMANVPDSAFSIVISHTPSMWDFVPKAVSQVNLMISGHVHSGQVKVCGHSPASYLYPLWSGLYLDRGRYLYVNDGIGYVAFPMRIGANPEITLFTLKRKS